MKTIVLITACMLCTASSVTAQQQPKSMYQGQMQMLDSNSDGSVSRAEYESFMSKAFANLDKNKDGVLQPDEVVKVLSAQQFALTDTNGNGSITQSEFMKKVLADFAAADRSRDGSLQ